MVFVPVSLASARALRSGQQPGALRGFAVTPALVQALGADLSEEEADFAALSTAGLAALTGPDRLDGRDRGRRLVLAAEVGADQVTDLGGEQGEVWVAGLGWGQVSALFADEDVAGDTVRAAAVEAAAAAAAGVEPAEALSGPAVATLSDTYDLLWYAPEELDALA